MEVEALRRMVKRWEDDQKVAVVVTDQDSKMAKVIRESRWNGKHE
jgi:cell shape-determining protein MreC